MAKKLKWLLPVLGAAALLIAVQGCKLDDDREIGDPWSHIEGLTATDWELSDVELIDEGNPSRPRKNIGRFFLNGEPTTLKFDVDGSFVSLEGAGGQVFPSEGTWAFDLDEAPRRINITSGGETLVANLRSPVRIIDNRLDIVIIKRTCVVDGEIRPALGYRFIFDRVN